MAPVRSGRQQSRAGRRSTGQRPDCALLNARSISDKDEVPGSSPGRPTSHSRRSQRCRQRAGNARRQPGPHRGRTPSPPARPLAPPGPPIRTSASATTTHRGRPPGPRTAATRQARPPRAAARSRAHSAAAATGRSARRPGLPGRSAVKPGRRRPTTRPRSATDTPIGRLASRAASPTSRPPGPSTEPLDGAAAHRPRSVPVVTVARHTGLVPNATA
jgi:hypothetical protein